ncbi:MAG: ankyrin repeat domain-containing protein, partial [Myxococcota bacterium]
AHAGDERMVALLLEAGADPTLREANGLTPAELARRADHAELADRLESGASGLRFFGLF